jgi:hypothetical protein
MKLLLVLLSTILSSIPVNSKQIFICSDKLDRFDCLNTYYCGWCNASKFNVNSYGQVCKQITNCNLTHEYEAACEYTNTIHTCKINTTILYLFLLGGMIGCCYLMIQIVYNLLNIVNYSKSFPLLFFTIPAIMLLAVNEHIYFMYIFISIGIYLLIVMAVACYKHASL